MLRFGKLALFVIPISFLLGVAWNIFEKSQKDNLQNQQLRILTYKGTFPPSLKKAIERKIGLSISLTLASNTQDWQQKKEEASYDIFFAYQQQAESLFKSNQALPLKTPHLEGSVHFISSDFVSPLQETFLPYAWGYFGIAFQKQKFPKGVPDWPGLFKKDYLQKIAMRTHPYESFKQTYPQVFSPLRKKKKKKRTFNPAYISLQPLQDLMNHRSWGAFISSHEWMKEKSRNKDLSFQKPQGQIPYWVLFVGISNKTQKASAAKTFIHRLFQKEMVYALLKDEVLSSTSKWSESEKFPEHIRASHLRKLPLRSLVKAPNLWL